MRKLLLCTQMIVMLLLLVSCGGKGSSEDALALRYRTDYLDMKSCEGTAELHADYGERVYDYTVSFQYQKDGEMQIRITAPESLAGTTARIAEGETRLEFDGVTLETGPLSPEGLSPVDAIPASLRYLCEGYIAECGDETINDRDCLRLQFRNPTNAAGEGTEAVVWLDKESGNLLYADMMQDGFTVLRCEFTAFSKA